MAKVPACYVKSKQVDFDGEALQFLGAGLPLPGLTLPAPVLGVFPLLELFTSRYFLDPLGCAPEDIAKGLYVFAHREKALPLVAEACRGGSAFEREAGAWFLRHSGAITANYPEIVRYTLHLPFEGFDLLPTVPATRCARCCGRCRWRRSGTCWPSGRATRAGKGSGAKTTSPTSTGS